VRLWLKRDDLIHPELVGNKWRKLKYNLQAASEQGETTLLSFGGAYSNHLRAVAAAGRIFGFARSGWCAARSTGRSTRRWPTSRRRG